MGPSLEVWAAPLDGVRPTLDVVGPSLEVWAAPLDGVRRALDAVGPLLEVCAAPLDLVAHLILNFNERARWDKTAGSGRAFRLPDGSELLLFEIHTTLALLEKTAVTAFQLVLG